MCLDSSCKYCIDPLCISNDKKKPMVVLGIVIHIIIAIISGFAAHATYGGDDDSDVFHALLWTAYSPFFDLIIILEQKFTYGPNYSCRWFIPGLFRFSMMVIAVVLYSVTLGLTFIAFDKNTSTFSGNVVKANAIILGILLIPALLWYTFVEISIICCCQFDFDELNSGGGTGSYSNDYTPSGPRGTDAHTYNYSYCSGTYTTVV